MSIRGTTNLDALVLEGGLGIGTSTSATFGTTSSVLVGAGTQTGTLTWVEASALVLTAGAWDLAGNSGTSSSTQFLGTTDAHDLVLKSNSATGLVIKQAGSVSIPITLSVGSTSTFTALAAFGSAVTIAYTMSATGAATFVSTISAAGNTSFLTASTFGSAVSVAGTFSASGNVALGGASTNTISTLGEILLMSGNNTTPGLGFSAENALGFSRDGAGSITISAQDTTQSRVILQNTTSAGATLFLLFTATGSSADNYIAFTEQSGTSWSIGRDDSASDNFKLSQNSTLGTNDFLTVTTAGVLTLGSSGTSQTSTFYGNEVVFKNGSTSTQVSILPSSVTTVGSAGTAAALPALPTGYFAWKTGSTTIKVPYYNT